MTKSKPLTRRQLGLLEALFVDEQDEKDVLDKCKVTRKLFNRWMTEPAFTEQLDKHSETAQRHSALHLARHATKAASKLVQLATSGKGETARKACLDIISMHAPSSGANASSSETSPGHPALPAETASRILAALVQEKDDLAKLGLDHR